MGNPGRTAACMLATSARSSGRSLLWECFAFLQCSSLNSVLLFVGKRFPLRPLKQTLCTVTIHQPSTSFIHNNPDILAPTKNHDSINQAVLVSPWLVDRKWPEAERQRPIQPTEQFGYTRQETKHQATVAKMQEAKPLAPQSGHWIMHSLKISTTS